MGKTFDDMEGAYSAMVSTLTIKPSWLPRANSQAQKINASKERYMEIAKDFGDMPWEFVGIIHMLESGCNFTRHLHNGDSLKARTWQVPAGRPLHGTPPFSFEESAKDALTMKNYAPDLAWTDERLCYEFERYNGFGYAFRGRPSPYLWSGSNHYTRGKFVKDGKYDAGAVSQQVGAMVLLTQLRELNKEVKVTAIAKASRRLSFFSSFKKFLASLGALSYLSLENFTEVKTFISDNLGLTILVTGIVLWLGFKYIDFLSLREVREGRYTPANKPEEETA